MANKYNSSNLLSSKVYYASNQHIIFTKNINITNAK